MTKATIAKIIATEGADTAAAVDPPAAEQTAPEAPPAVTDDKVKDMFSGAGDDDDLSNATKA